MWVAAKLFFSGVLERLLKAFVAACEWLLEEPLRLATLVFALAWAWSAFIIVPNITVERDDALAALSAEQKAHTQTITNYREAKRVAEAQAKENLTRVAAEQAQITQETIDDYEARLAAARSHAERLRSQFRAASADIGGPRPADLPGSSAASGRPDEAPVDPQFSAAIGSAGACPASLICLTVDEALIATEQAIQLDELINWVEATSKIPAVLEPAEEAP